MKYVKAGDRIKGSKDVWTAEEAAIANEKLAELAARVCGMPRRKDGKPCQRHHQWGVCPNHEILGQGDKIWVAIDNEYNKFALPILEEQQKSRRFV